LGREDYYFRRGFPYLAVAPLSDVENMGAWRYFAGSIGGQPLFVAGESNAKPLPPFGNERPPEYGQPPYHRCVGEYSVAYVPTLAKGVMAYACGSNRNAGFHRDNVRGIYMRTADTPWGRWSAPRLVFDPSSGYCRFMHRKVGCTPGQPNPGDLERVERSPDFSPKTADSGEWDLMFGGEYAPFLIPSYTSRMGDETSLYFTMSTWNPYQVVLMRARVRPLRSFIFTDLRSTLQRGLDFFRGRG
jgi:hypothetical protein